MNTKLCAALLLPLAASMLSAQDLALRLSRPMDSIAASVYSARADSLVVLVLGFSPAAIALPGDQILGVQPDLVTGFQLADRNGAAHFRVRLVGQPLDFDVFAQAIAIAPDRLLEDRGTIATSTVQVVPPAEQQPG